LAGDLCLHHWQRLLGDLPLAPITLVAGPLLPRLAFATLALALPSALFLLARPFFTAPRLRRTLYGLLPLVWALLLARHLPIGMAEAGSLLPVSLAALPAKVGDGSGDWLALLPVWRADGHVIAFCQSAVVLIGLVAAVVVLRRLLANHRLAWLAASALALGLAGAGRWLVAAA
ncbi:MAG: hypothetical protein RLZZ124_404, partial [Cyanobacteriota bacterium]